MLSITVTKSTPATLAPRHNPVDMAPHPEYISNNDSSVLQGVFLDVLSTLDFVAFSWFGIPEENKNKTVV